jgi:predicted dehydrogenase
MKQIQQNRRSFIKTGTAVGTLTALNYRNVLGANDRLRVGVIGCGGRGKYHIQWLHRTAEKENVTVVAASDVWDVRRKEAQTEIQRRFEHDAALHKNYRDLLADKNIDAVTIATPDHQHCGMLIEAVQAGKDVYVEKPITNNDLKELNKTYDVVKASDRIVQHGTQGRSSEGAAAAREFIRSGRLGKIFRVEECRSHYQPYWNHYACPATEAETDWKGFLYNRPYQPFNSDKHGHWMGYREFSSSGTIGGWMSHFVDFTSYLLDCGFPETAVTYGGIYAPTSDPRRTTLDNVTTQLHYNEGFILQFTTHFGSGANDFDNIYGDKGLMRMGKPDGNIGGLQAVITGEGSEHPEKINEEIRLDNTTQEDHMLNWIRCVRSRKEPNANMDCGYRHGIAVILADRAYDEKRMMRFDPEKREIVPA